MKRQLEDWELEMVLGGDAPPDVLAAAQTPAHQARLAEMRGGRAQPVRAALSRRVPNPLTLGEWHLGMLEGTTLASVSTHLDECPHCQTELASLIELVNQPMGQQSAPHKLVQRIVLTLQSMAGGSAPPSPAVALRGDTWTACFSSETYMVMVTRNAHATDAALEGSVIALDEIGGQAELREASTARYTTTIGAGSAFTFDTVAPGLYDLLITTDDGVELLMNNLDLQA